MKAALFLILTFALLGCAQGPDSKQELATQGLFAASFSTDGRQALIASQLHGASFWSLDPLERSFNWNHQQGEYTQITSTALSANLNRAATVHRNQWILWDTNTGAAIRFLQTPSEIHSIALNDDGSRVLLGLANGDVWYTDTITGNNLHEFKHEEAVRSVALSRDGTIALSGSDDYSASFWDLRSGEQIKKLTLENRSRHVAFSKSGNFAFVSSLRNDHLIIDIKDFSVRSRIEERYTIFNGAEFGEDDQSVYLANQQGYVQVFSTESGKELQRFKAERKALFGAARSIITLWADNAQLKALTSDGQLQSFSLNR